MLEGIIVFIILMVLSYALTIGFMVKHMKALESQIDYWKNAYWNVFEMYQGEQERRMELEQTKGF